MYVGEHFNADMREMSLHGWCWVLIVLYTTNYYEGLNFDFFISQMNLNWSEKNSKRFHVPSPCFSSLFVLRENENPWVSSFSDLNFIFPFTINEVVCWEFVITSFNWKQVLETTNLWRTNQVIYCWAINKLFILSRLTVSWIKIIHNP